MSNYLRKYRRYAFRILGIILPLKCPLSLKTTNFASTTFHFDICNYSSRCTDKKHKKSYYLGKYHRFAFWIFGIISPAKCPLSIETTNFVPTTLNFDISNYFCTKDERSKKSNYLGKYRRSAFWIFGIISHLKCPLSVETINFAPTTLNFDIPNHFCIKDERSKESNFLGKYRRYAFWIFGIISPVQFPLSAETTNLPHQPLISTNLIILVLWTSGVKSRIILGNIADTRFESLGLYQPWNVRYPQKPPIFLKQPLISTYVILFVLRTNLVKSRTISENIADTPFESLGFYHPQNIRYPQKPSILPQQPLISTYLIIFLVLRTSGVKNRITSENITVTRFESSGLYHPWNVRYL